MLAPLALRTLALWLALVAGCSTALSPYAADNDPEFEAPARDAGSARTGISISSAQTGHASPAPAVATTPPPPVVSPPLPPGDRPPVSPMGSAQREEPWFSLDQDLPSCTIHNLTLDCPVAETVLASQGREPLPCRRDQVGQRCAYPSAKREANLLECSIVNGAGHTAWQFRRARCARDCFSEIPHSFAELSTSDCLARPAVACDDMATEQDSADNLLKGVARTCALPEGMVLGLLLSSDGCGRALFIDSATVPHCVAEQIKRWRLGCTPRCVSTKEPGSSLLE